MVQGEDGEFLDETLPQTIPEIQKEMQAVNKQAKGVREVMQRADWNASSPEGLNVTAQQEELIDLRERLQQQLLHAKAGRKIVNRLQATGHARQLVPDEDHIMSAPLRGPVATAADHFPHGFMHTTRSLCIRQRLQMHRGLQFLAELQRSERCMLAVRGAATMLTLRLHAFRFIGQGAGLAVCSSPDAYMHAWPYLLADGHVGISRNAWTHLGSRSGIVQPAAWCCRPHDRGELCKLREQRADAWQQQAARRDGEAEA